MYLPSRCRRRSSATLPFSQPFHSFLHKRLAAWIYHEGLPKVDRAQPSRMASTATSSTAVSSNSGRAQAEARAAVLASLESAGSNYDANFQRRATDLHTNAAAIEKQEVELKKQATALARESAKWQKEVDKATRGVNEIGHVQNWAEMMERDLLVLEETLRLAEGGDHLQNASGGSSWRLP